MSEQMTISASVGAGGTNRAADTYTVQFLLNVARARLGMAPIGLDGGVGQETIGAIRDFQLKSFGAAKVDGRVDPNHGTFRRLLEINNEPALSSPKTYTKGKHNRYKVTVGSDGRIFVQPKDWLSKYSAAIYGDYYHVFDFARMENGTLHLLRDPNLIRAGEVLYHLPTWYEFMKGKNKAPIPEPKMLTPEEKKEISKDAIKGDFQFRGEHGIKVADGVGEFLSWAEPVVEVLSWLIPALGNAAEGLSIIGIPFGIYGNIRDFLNASEAGERQYSMRAAAYSITAWAYEEVCPTKSPVMWMNFQKQPLSAAGMQRMQKAWDTSAAAARRWHEQFAREKMGPNVSIANKEGAWKATLRQLSDNKKAKLSEMLMRDLGNKALAKESNSIKTIWQANLKYQYPE